MRAQVIRLSPVTTGRQTQGDLVAYSNPSGAELPNPAAAVSQARTDFGIERETEDEKER